MCAAGVRFGEEICLTWTAISQSGLSDLGPGNFPVGEVDKLALTSGRVSLLFLPGFLSAGSAEHESEEPDQDGPGHD